MSLTLCSPLLNHYGAGGLAVDWINDRIYFSFGDYGSNLVNPNHLAMYDLDNGVVTEITSAIALVYKKFHDLAVDAIGE